MVEYMLEEAAEAEARDGLTLLIVAFTFPPQGGVGGLRPFRLAQSLTKRGWRVVVLAPEVTGPVGPAPPSGGASSNPPEIVRTAYGDRAQIFGRFLRRTGNPSPPISATQGSASPTPRGRLWLTLRSLLLFPDAQIGWRRDAIAAGSAIFKRRRVSVMLTTSPPETCHMIGAELKRRTGVPWIADFRDPWSFSHLRKPSSIDPLHARAEARALRSADAIVTVSEGWGRRFRGRYPRIPCHVIRNGYSGPVASGRQASRDRFRILYTGKLDPEQQDPSAFLEGLAAWLRGDPEAAARVETAFHFYGDGAERIERVLRAARVPTVSIGGVLDHQQSLDAQGDAAVLLLFSWRRDPDCVPAKLFDYLAARRPILVLGEESTEAARIVREAAAGRSANSAEEVERALASLFVEWSQGSVPAGPIPDSLAGHDFERRTDEYDSLLRSIALSPRP